MTRMPALQDDDLTPADAADLERILASGTARPKIAPQAVPLDPTDPDLVIIDEWAGMRVDGD